MATLFPIPQQFKDNWDELRSTLMGPMQSKPSVMNETNTLPGHVLDAFSEMIYPSKPEEAFMGGVAGLAPGMIAANYRSPQMIQALRTKMAEEFRARGPMAQVPGGTQKVVTPEGTYATIEQMAGADPMERIARGGWYHGMSGEARKTLWNTAKDLPTNRIVQHPKDFGGIGASYIKSPYGTKDLPFELGLPQSLHDAQSISNKLGEPSGVSLSALPTKSQQFSADEYIHRVLPLFGGSPRERLVNLMTPEGRKTLNDAYDVVFNTQTDISNMARRLNTVLGSKNFGPKQYPMEQILDDFWIGTEGSLGRGNVGRFNQALSSQLQSQGKRGILYNPQRWDEYEMLMLDPKYVLPLDYRKFQEYANPVTMRANRKLGFGGGPLETRSATPGVQKGLTQIQDIMSQNKSRLGDIYSERPWTQRLSKENKDALIQIIDPDYRELIGNQLYRGY